MSNVSIDSGIHSRGEVPVGAVNRVVSYSPSSRPSGKERGGDHHKQQQAAGQWPGYGTS